MLASQISPRCGRTSTSSRFALDDRAKPPAPDARRASACSAAGGDRRSPGCGGDDGETLTVYSGRHYGIETAFEQWSEETGVDVEFLTGNDAELRERIAAEGEDTEADVYLTVDAGNLWAAAEDGIFQPLDSTVLDESIPGRAARRAGPLVRARRAGPHDRLQHRPRRPRRRADDVRGAGRPGVRRAGSACATPTTTTSSRSSPA